MLISRFRKSIELPAGDRRIAARMTLALVAAVLCLVLVLAGASMGVTGSFVSAQPSPSGSPSGGGGETPTIFFLNPNASATPDSDVREPSADGPPPTEDPTEPPYPRISDKFDGVDEAYHIVAVVHNAPSDAFVELYFQPDTGGNEMTIGQMTPLPGSDDAYEFLWEIPEAPFFGYGTMRVRLYDQTAEGFEEVANDELRVRVQQRTTDGFGFPEGPSGPPIDPVNEPRVPEAETVEILWPSDDGPLGFFKTSGPDTLWRAWVNGTTSPALDEPTSTGATQVWMFYSVSPPGERPEFVHCGTFNSSTGGPEGAEQWAGNCILAGAARPSQVTAVAAVATQNQSRSTDAPQYSMESADAHTVQPYVQSPDEMKIDVLTSTTGGFALRRRRAADTNCLTYLVRVTDQFDRPVQGANLDVHLRGPTDQVEFANDTTSADASSGFKAPDKGHLSKESGRNCDSIGSSRGEQGDHNVPGGNDFKHRESTLGAGVSGGASIGGGGWRFHLFSTTPGITEITAWVDEETIPDETVKREPDDDILEVDDPNTAQVEGEAVDTNFAQWLSGPITVTIDPAGATAAAGTCQRYVVKMRDGARPVPDANVDVHASGPNNDLDFCDPGDASLRAAPNQGTGHNAEDSGETSHSGQPPVAQHTEGVTNDQGNFVIGLTSPVVGDTTITAWHDGEETFDNDDFATSEPNGSATTNWVASTADAAISFVNPSPYGPGPESDGDGTNVGKRQDVDQAFHVLARVASLEPVAGVEFFYRSGSNPLVKIGDGQRIGASDTYEVFWPVDVIDGNYTLVARILNTATVAEQAIVVNNTTPASPPNPTDVPFETAEITAPLNGDRATFANGRLTVKGVASSGAEGVDLFYTKASSIATPSSSAWIFCGYAGMPTGTAPKEFSGQCELQGPDQPGQVTGIAALTYDCVQSGCNGAPGAGPEGVRNPGVNDSGDAHRVFGAEADPLLAVEPAETAANTGTCQKFVVSLTDQTGQPIPGQNIDAHLTGPGNSGNFCSPEDGTGTARRAPDQGSHTADGDETDEAYHEEGGTRVHHTETETTGNGKFVLGIESETAGDAQLTVWLDDGDNDVQDQNEISDISVMHWEEEGVCDITGTDGPDTLQGSDAPEKICGFGGNDVIRGGGGDDDISGGTGRDSLRGNAGSDRVRGGAGRDSVFGGGGGDDLAGGRGFDVVKGHRSNDRLRGNTGNDRLDGGTGRDDCSGGAGRDTLRRCETGTRSFAARLRLI
ncbi:MAG: hypothetical protein M3217_01885 [Actinomycetota bacterium]|nr:hypothetical protein [Actinomycetota bacterium]